MLLFIGSNFGFPLGAETFVNKTLILNQDPQQDL